MEKRTRKKYSREFKVDTLNLLKKSGMSVKEVSGDLGIAPELLYRWRSHYEKDKDHSFPGEGNLKPEEEELRKLRKRLRDVTEERDILKKAIAFFCKEEG
ncbi:transposase [Bacteroidota bacterium]